MRAVRAALVLLALSLLAPLAGAPVGASHASAPHDPAVSTPSHATDGQPHPALQAGLDRPDPYLVIDVQVRPNGDARWQLQHRFVVESRNETQAFRTLATQVTDGSVDLGYDRSTFDGFVAEASAATGRSMELSNASWQERIDSGTAILSFSFTWENFARTDNGTVYVRDAWRSANGTWFPYLPDGQRLVLSAPSGYEVSNSTSGRGVVNGSMTWDGPKEFQRGYIRATYEPNGQTGPQSPLPPAAIVGLILLVVGVAAGGYLVAHRRPTGLPSIGRPDTGRDGVGDPETPLQEEPPEAQSESTTGQESGGATTEPPDEPDEPEQAPVDPELLSDEERIERLLEDNGGRMKQANIVKETGWSNAKVSQLLSAMDEDDRINKLRIGRENLITLPDEDVTEF